MKRWSLIFGVMIVMGMTLYVITGPEPHTLQERAYGRFFDRDAESKIVWFSGMSQDIHIQKDILSQYKLKNIPSRYVNCAFFKEDDKLVMFEMPKTECALCPDMRWIDGYCFLDEETIKNKCILRGGLYVGNNYCCFGAGENLEQECLVKITQENKNESGKEKTEDKVNG